MHAAGVLLIAPFMPWLAARVGARVLDYARALRVAINPPPLGIVTLTALTRKRLPRDQGTPPVYRAHPGAGRGRERGERRQGRCRGRQRRSQERCGAQDAWRNLTRRLSRQLNFSSTDASEGVCAAAPNRLPSMPACRAARRPCYAR